MSDRIRVFIADDHDVVVRGIKDILSEQPDMEVVGTAFDGIGLLGLVMAAKPDVLLLDVRMPNFNVLEAIDAFVALGGEVGLASRNVPNIVLVTSHLDAFLARKVYDCGVGGYLLKEDALSKRLPSTIRAVDAGGWAYSEAVQDLLRNPSAGRASLSFGGDQFTVMCLMVDGYDSVQIAQMMGKTLSSIYTTQHRIRMKLGVETNSAVVKLAIQERLVPLGKSATMNASPNPIL